MSIQRMSNEAEPQYPRRWLRFGGVLCQRFTAYTVRTVQDVGTYACTYLSHVTLCCEYGGLQTIVSLHNLYNMIVYDDKLEVCTLLWKTFILVVTILRTKCTQHSGTYECGFSQIRTQYSKPLYKLQHRGKIRSIKRNTPVLNNGFSCQINTCSERNTVKNTLLPHYPTN